MHDAPDTCPLCLLEKKLNAIEEDWSDLPREVRSESAGDTLMSIVLDSASMAVAFSPLCKLARGFDLAGCARIGGEPHASTFRDAWSTWQEVDTRGNALATLSECGQVAEYVWYLLAGRDTGRVKYSEMPSSATQADVPPKQLLSAKNLASFLKKFEIEQSCIAQLGLTEPTADSSYVSDHTFMVVRCGPHYALYQSWARRFLMFQRQRWQGSVNFWNMDRAEFTSQMNALIASKVFRQRLFRLRPSEETCAEFRCVTGNYIPVKAMFNVRQSLSPSSPFF